MIMINEIFYSIQGESTRMGLPTVFVRSTGCHLRCNYCDTMYAYKEGTKMSVEDVLIEVKKHGTPYVCLTGGEPMLQKEMPALAKTLCDEGFQVSLETSGDLSCAKIDMRVKKIIDIKTPDSDAFKGLHVDNFPQMETVDVKDEYKFVICSEDDFEWSENFCNENSLFENNVVLYSPSHEDFDAKWLAEKILKRKSKARLQLQLHKYIWSSSKRSF